MLRACGLQQRIRDEVRAHDACALAAAALLAGIPAQGGNLPHTDVAQQGTYLCWAAASATAWSALGGGKTMCGIVSDAVKPECCVSDNVVVSDMSCDVPTPFDSASDYVPDQVAAWRKSLPPAAGARLYPAQAFLRHEIEPPSRRPVIVWWRYGEPCAQAGHLVTAVGLNEQTSPAEVLVSDPRPGNSMWMQLPTFQCGPVGRGQCAIYYAIGPSQEDYGDVTDTEVTCSEAVVPAAATANLTEVAQRLFAKLGPGIAEPLGLPTEGEVVCPQEDQILVEYDGSLGYRYLLLECKRSGSAFLAAVRPANLDFDIIWYGGAKLAGALAEARDLLPSASGRLVLRIDPVSGDATLYRASNPSPGIVLSYSG